MGAGDSKPDGMSTPETPHFAAYAKLFNLTEDPRSPTDSRTPILVQNTLIDPRSPNSDADRTPIFSIPEPISPFVRFKLDNPIYQDSPLSLEKSGASTKGVCSDAVVEEFKNLEIANKEDKKEQMTTDNDVTSSVNKEEDGFKIKKRNISKNSGRTKAKQSLLKTALFQPYMDKENSAELSQPQSQDLTPKRATPLQSKNNFVIANKNIIKDTESSEEKISKQKLQGSQKNDCGLSTRKNWIVADKENVLF